MSGPVGRFSGDALAVEFAARLYTTVGAFFCNTRRAWPDVCVTCTGPAIPQSTPAVCAQCRTARENFGEALADLVVPLAYAKGYMPTVHQSAHHVRAYKAVPPALKCAQDLRLMAGAATYLHGRCIGSWQAVTFVPSAKRPGSEHPVAQLARAVHAVAPSATKIVLGAGKALSEDRSRIPLRERFFVPDEYRPHVTGRHVLVVDDTWVSGDKAQSASLALKNAGARRVTILCVTRWLRYGWDDHRKLIELLTEPYHPWRCPVTGDECP